MTQWHLSTNASLVLDRPRLIAILNLTPDSFSDGGELPDVDAAVRAATIAVRDGADMLEVGGESTRPGAASVPSDEQIRRVVPAITAIRAMGGPLSRVPIGIDTTRSDVAEAALNAGADAINDVSAGTDDAGMFTLAARRRAGLVLMHRLRAPKDDRYSDRYDSPPGYADVIAEVRGFLQSRVAGALSAGVTRASIVIDPGLGFGKSVEQNLELIRRTDELLALGYPVMSALSRKSFVGRVAAGEGVEPAPPRERDAASIAFSIVHMQRGARLFRVHNVRAHHNALRSAWAISRPRS